MESLLGKGGEGLLVSVIEQHLASKTKPVLLKDVVSALKPHTQSNLLKILGDTLGKQLKGVVKMMDQMVTGTQPDIAILGQSAIGKKVLSYYGDGGSNDIWIDTVHRSSIYPCRS